MAAPERNIHGEVIDRSGARWLPSGEAEIEVLGASRDRTAEMGLTRPNIWSEGGVRERVTLRFDLFIPKGASRPDMQEVLARVMEALRNG